ncbi:MAG: hypothetical protein KDB23_02930, partial [Planctomycetales bacterium]|nr:hypothetical protein [Planctomycetales bacterium]
MILPGTTLDLSIAGESDTNPVDGMEQTTGLYLRIRNGTHDGRLIRLGQRKCTIGASSSCTLRLVSPACQPVHCVIIRGRRGTAIRRWSHDTRLNGEEFLDSWLQPGDLLEVGDVTLEIVADRLSPDQHRGSLLQATDSERRRQVTHERLASSRQTNRRRVQRLVRLVRRVSQQLGLVHVELAGERDRVEQLTSQADLLHRQLDEVTASEQRSLEDNELHRQRIESLETELGELES